MRMMLIALDGSQKKTRVSKETAVSYYKDRLTDKQCKDYNKVPTRNGSNMWLSYCAGQYEFGIHDSESSQEVNNS